MITYSLEKVKNDWYIIKTVEMEHSIGSIGIYHGSRKQCEKYSKDNKIKLENLTTEQ